MADDFLVLENVRFGYGERVIIRDVSMRFARGSVTALMGGSGCGKTTILRLIGGQARPQQGRIVLEGQEIQGLDRDGWYRVRRKMGMLFQFGALFTDMSVFDNVAFPIREHTELAESMVRDLVLMKLNAVGLRGAASLKPSEISGGMARRVALARAIALDPPLLLYDEPFAGLDPISMGTIAHLIRSLNDALGATSLVVTHDVHETVSFCDYGYVLGDGRVLGEGRPEALLASEEPHVAQFMHGRRDGPVPFHYPAAPLAEQFGVDR